MSDLLYLTYSCVVAPVIEKAVKVDCLNYVK